MCISTLVWSHSSQSHQQPTPLAALFVSLQSHLEMERCSILFVSLSLFIKSSSYAHFRCSPHSHFYIWHIKWKMMWFCLVSFISVILCFHLFPSVSQHRYNVYIQEKVLMARTFASAREMQKKKKNWKSRTRKHKTNNNNNSSSSGGNGQPDKYMHISYKRPDVCMRLCVVVDTHGVPYCLLARWKYLSLSIYMQNCNIHLYSFSFVWYDWDRLAEWDWKRELNCLSKHFQCFVWLRERPRAR